MFMDLTTEIGMNACMPVVRFMSHTPGSPAVQPEEGREGLLLATGCCIVLQLYIDQ